MTFAQNPIATFVKQPQNGKAVITNGVGTTNTNVYTAGANGTKISGLNATNNDGTAKSLTVSILNGSTLFPLGVALLGVNAGANSTTASVDCLSQSLIPGLPVDSDGHPYIILVSGDSLQVTCNVAPGTGNTVTVVATCGDF